MQSKVKKIVEKIIDNPNIGKPLRYELTGLRSVRVPPFRILYEHTGDCPVRASILHNCSREDYRMKLLADENIPASVVSVLKEEGYDIRWIRIDSQEIPLNPSGHINVQVYAGG
jgi:hypothetical protein